ncbi:hypothetical protein B484DRAFT_472562 [Ochromonadaceae sp. CCMP2298]|nr:hypothetical protein B484DRAFT_472562 [Ochromonadaceae sp. CCMP2298]
MSKGKKATNTGGNSTKGIRSSKVGPAEAPASGTPVVSAEKLKKRKSEGEASAAASATPTILKFDTSNIGISASPKSEDSKSQESGEEEEESSGVSSGEESVANSNDKPKIADDENGTDFDGTVFGLSRHATKGNLQDLLARSGPQYDNLVEQLRLSQNANQTAQNQKNFIVSDMSNYHITNERVNADGFRKLREKCESEGRAQRDCDRNLLISLDAQKLIGQMLAARKVPGFAHWLTWTDTVFFEVMSKIYPAGKTQQIANLQDYLAKTRCDWFLDNHPASLLSFVGEINEGTRVYSAELARATSGGFIESVQREAVSTLLNRVNSGVNDSDRQPPSVRAGLKTRILFEGRPKNIDDFILRLLTEGDFIATCNAEMTTCGVNYRLIGQTGGERDTMIEGRKQAAKSSLTAAGKGQQQRGGPGADPLPHSCAMDVAAQGTDTRTFPCLPTRLQRQQGTVGDV